MSVYVDVYCADCDTMREDVWSSEIGSPCICGGSWEMVWRLTEAPAPGTHPSEKVVVYESAQEGGRIQYPGTTNTPVPERLRSRGYVRKELNVRDLASFEKKHHVANERRHFDRNGRGF